MRDNADNPVGLVDTNPKLDTQSFTVDFADGNQANLTANLIAKPFSSLSDPDRNQCPIGMVSRPQMTLQCY